MANRRGRRANPKRRLAVVCTWLVVMQHLALHAVFLFDPYKPAMINVPELWAMNRKWQFWLLLGIVAGSSSLSLVALRLRAPIKLTLLVSWSTFLAIMLTVHAERLQVMWRLMLKHG